MTPDLILLGGEIVTMDPALPRAQALAIGAGRILVLGSDADMRDLAGPGTAVVQAGGRLVLPGLQDGHIHLLDGGTDLLTSVSLYGVTTIPQMQDRLARHAAGYAGPLVIGSGWPAGPFGDHNLTRAVLDAVLPDRPCILYDSSAHLACLNSAACTVAGLTAETPDPPQGRFVRDSAGTPTGMLHEDAAVWARARLPALTDADCRNGLRAGMAHANRHGLTGIIDPTLEDYHLRAYAALAAEDALSLHVAGAAVIRATEPPEAALARLTALRLAHDTGRFAVNAAKFYLDGVLENRTAAMLAPYADAAGGNAPLMFPPDLIARHFTGLDAARFQIHVHAIGDLATRAALDGLAAARAVNGPWPGLHQVAHLEVVDPADYPRFAALDAMANLQPLWARRDPIDPDLWLEMVGEARAGHVYPFRSLINAGAPYCLGSDWPVSTLNPFEIMETAVTRQARQDEGPHPPLQPQERLTVLQSLAGYTRGSAAAAWRGATTGRLAPGCSADLIVTDRNIVTCPAAEIGGTEVLLTLFRGRTVHRAPGFDG